MSTPNEDQGLFERYGVYKLINVFRACPRCDRDVYRQTINTERECPECRCLVFYPAAAKRYIIKAELSPTDKSILKRIEEAG